LDKFHAEVFGAAEDLHNTHHGGLPGHHQSFFAQRESAPKDTYTIFDGPWKRF